MLLPSANKNMAEPMRRSTGIPLFGPSKPKVAMTATDAATQMVREAIVTHGLAVPNESPTAMDKAIDNATFYLQRLGRFPPQEAIDKCRTDNDMEALLEAFEDDPLDFPAEPFLKRSVSYYLAERSMVAYLTGCGEMYLDVCVITSPTRFCDQFTVTICDAYPNTIKAGMLFFYREPYLDADVKTGEVTEREHWHALVPQDYTSAGNEETVPHQYSFVPAVPAAVPGPVPGPVPAPVVTGVPPTQSATTSNSQKLDHAASGRPFAHLTTDSILASPTFDPDLISGELAIRIGLHHSYVAVEAAIKASSGGKKSYVAKSNFFTKRVTAALNCKAARMGLTEEAMRAMYADAKKDAKRAGKEGTVFTLPGWVVL